MPRRPPGATNCRATPCDVDVVAEPEEGGTVQVHRIIEVLTVLLLAVATVGSAWCAYQVSQWNGRETDAARESAVARINGSREYALATQKVAYDAASVAQYAEAVVDGNERLQTFLRTSIIRPGVPPVARRVAGLHRRDRRAAAEPRRERGVPRRDLFAESTKYDEAALAASIEGDEAGATPTTTSSPRCSWRVRCSSPASRRRSPAG